MFVIDVHAHLVPRTFPPCPQGVPAEEWPVLEPLDDGRARMVIGGKEFRIFEPAYWDVPGRIAYMDAEGIDLQVLSPLPELLGYWFSPQTTEALANHMNGTIADAVASSNGRLAGIGMLPLQDVPRSLNMIDKLAATGLRGVMVASNVNGVSLADERFHPVFAALEAANLSVFVHGYRPAGTERFLGSPLLAATIGVPQDNMAVIASFMATDIMGRFPKLKLGFVHGGGAFGAVLDRMNHVWNSFAELRAVMPVSPREYVRKFFFDTVTFSADYLRYLVEAFGTEGMMAGTDGPTPIGQKGLRAYVGNACKGDPALTEAVLWQNAVRFFSLDDLDAVKAAQARFQQEHTL